MFPFGVVISCMKVCETLIVIGNVFHFSIDTWNLGEYIETM